MILTIKLFAESKKGINFKNKIQVMISYKILNLKINYEPYRNLAFLNQKT